MNRRGYGPRPPTKNAPAQMAGATVAGREEGTETGTTAGSAGPGNTTAPPNRSAWTRDVNNARRARPAHHSPATSARSVKTIDPNRLGEIPQAAGSITPHNQGIARIRATIPTRTLRSRMATSPHALRTSMP